MEYSDFLQAFSFASGMSMWMLIVFWRLLRQFLTREQVGLPYLDHDSRYQIADEYLSILYKYVAISTRTES